MGALTQPTSKGNFWEEFWFWVSMKTTPPPQEGQGWEQMLKSFSSGVETLRKEGGWGWGILKAKIFSNHKNI